MDEILSSICMCNASKSEGMICHYKIFLRSDFYVAIITRMINWLVNLPLILQSYSQDWVIPIYILIKTDHDDFVKYYV